MKCFNCEDPQIYNINFKKELIKGVYVTYKFPSCEFCVEFIKGKLKKVREVERFKEVRRRYVR